MRFFFLSSSIPEADGPWDPPRRLLQHLRALRISQDQAFLLLPPRGEGTVAMLQEDGKLLLQGRQARPELPLLPVTLATAWPKGARADELVRRATESGVHRILPLATARSVAGREAFSPAKRERYQRIMEEVASQCRRPLLPDLRADPLAVAELASFLKREEPTRTMAATLTPGTLPLLMSLEIHAPPAVFLAIGPEGGFTAEEEQEMAAQGFLHAGLTPTVLRIEAAGPLAAGLCQHHALMRRGH